MKDLKEKTIRGGAARLSAQGVNFFLRIGTLMVLARLLGPFDFGLVGMVTAFTGVLSLFRDFGLSSAAIQRSTVTDEQFSTLFWINMVVGVLLGLLAVAMAPAVAAFYHDPRLFAVTAVLGAGFLFNAAGVQHGALLQRQMRFTAIAITNTAGLVIGAALAVGGALAGYGYWALVAMSVALPLSITVGYWIATGWVPGRPRRGTGIRSMMRFGGTLTVNGLVVYIASNLEKVLLGRFWGADILGIYGRAYQIVNIPTDNLNTSAGEVAFSALSRLQDDPHRLRNYFLKGYSLILALTLPVTIACALFAGDVILVLLGPKWTAAAPILRLLAPTILVFAIANPLSWMLTSLGFVNRLLKMGLVVTPIMITGYAIGLHYGPNGVAFGYSAAMVLWLMPLIAWSVHGTPVRFKDVMVTAGRPLACAVVAGGIAFAVRFAYGQSLAVFPRLVLECGVLLVAFMAILLFVAGQKTLYLDLLRGLKRSAPVEEKSLVSA
ncbi:MAG TPA: lipopolysaccharide biosynthesis protein [Terriglobia bacterium]|nr:lipopolysaccharide biosynthesis protein [Terriglobia bacterium]